jgi:hypothetical protein
MGQGAFFIDAQTLGQQYANHRRLCGEYGRIHRSAGILDTPSETENP